jgi:hypothetical protein
MTSRFFVGAFLAVGLSVTLAGQRGASETTGSPAPARFPHNAAEFDELFRQVSNWGRWGKDDQLGSANLVTEAKRKQAAALVRVGCRYHSHTIP